MKMSWLNIYLNLIVIMLIRLIIYLSFRFSASMSKNHCDLLKGIKKLYPEFYKQKIVKKSATTAKLLPQQ